LIQLIHFSIVYIKPLLPRWDWNVTYSKNSYCPIFQSGNYHLPSPVECSISLWSRTLQ